MKEKNTRIVVKRQNIIQACLIIFLIIILNLFSIRFFYRFDLTKEKRFSITESSKKILSDLNDNEKIYIEVYLDGDNLPFELIRLQKTVREFLNNLSSYSKNIDYVFINPFAGKKQEDQRNIAIELMSKQLFPTQLQVAADGSVSQRMIFAGAIVKYAQKEYAVNFLNNNTLTQNTKNVSLSETELERDFIHAIWILSRKTVQKIAFLEGHSELDEDQTYDIMLSLSKYYQIDRLTINQQLYALDEYSAVVIAKPQAKFSDQDKYIIDQYIMNGGSVLWLIEWIKINMDSLANKPYEMAMINDVRLSDQLFKYGVRINPDLIQDLTCLSIPVNVTTIDGKSSFEPTPWFYFPVIIPDTLSNHQLLKNLEPARTHFVSSIDTVSEDYNVKKTILLRTSEYSKSLTFPIQVSLTDLMREKPDIKTFNKSRIPIAVLLEGTFQSAFKNRFTLDTYENVELDFMEESKPDTKMIVISDGDFIRNEIKTFGGRKEKLKLGQDFYYPNQYTPGNSQFIINCINYLCADNDFISIRMRETKIRLLNTTLLEQEKNFWIYINSLLPVVLIIIFGFTVILIRKMKFKNKTK